MLRACYAGMSSYNLHNMMQSEQALSAFWRGNEAMEVGSSLILYKNRGKEDTKNKFEGI